MGSNGLAKGPGKSPSMRVHRMMTELTRAKVTMGEAPLRRIAPCLPGVILLYMPSVANHGVAEQIQLRSKITSLFWLLAFPNWWIYCCIVRMGQLTYRNVSVVSRKSISGILHFSGAKFVFLVATTLWETWRMF